LEFPDTGINKFPNSFTYNKKSLPKHKTWMNEYAIPSLETEGNKCQLLFLRFKIKEILMNRTG
jgi:hypothetical protein